MDILPVLLVLSVVLGIALIAVPFFASLIDDILYRRRLNESIASIKAVESNWRQMHD